MKRWWQTVVKDYFTFSARERNGIVVFFILMAIILFASRYYPVRKTSIPKDAFQKELASLKISIDSSRNTRQFNYDDDNDNFNQPRHYASSEKVNGELFAFDPNTLDAEGWKRLGVREKTIHTIQNFLAKGYRFKQPGDIHKIYGLRQQEADRLEPFVRIAGNAAATANSSLKNDNSIPVANNFPDRSRNVVLDINTADTSALISLPGLGSKLAARIVNFRQKLGGFYSVDQVAETYSVPDSTFKRIKPRLQFKTPVFKTININSADINVLKSHPYIKWNIANAIVNYRMQHGGYKSINDLRKIDIISDDLFNKIAPYLVL